VAKTSSKPKSEYAIQTVSNALRMLEVFQSEAEIGVSDLARRLGLHKNNAFRLLATLELSGYIQQSCETELYRLGPACLELGQAFSRNHTLMGEARPILEELAKEVGETAHLGILRGDEVVHLDGVLPDQLVLTGSRVGERLPSHCTALGKVLLSGEMVRSAAVGGASAGSGAAARGPGAEGLAALADQPLESFTAATIVDSAKLLEQLRAIQLQGYAVDLEEVAPGLRCVAAPVRDANAYVVAALSLSGPSIRLPEEKLHGAAAGSITDAAARLSHELGFPH
jgi:DNA-binding IclR family transcriptional regulator